MEIKPVTVGQLSAYLKQIFDSEELLHNISVVGEISGWTNKQGAVYFSLKDETAVLSCVYFDCNDENDFKNGDKVVVVGSPRYYVKGGKLNFNVSFIKAYGIGELYQSFLLLKEKLSALGYFDESIKKQMPLKIKRIGVVTSQEGAVIQDIINVRTRRNPNIDIVLYPVKVQGVNAEFDIAKGIKVLDNYEGIDVIVVARGGGSIEDLQPFNTEIVAKAVYDCNKPVVSAVGHETDFTIIDFCSDLRAPTPSAAAEILCNDINENRRLFKIKLFKFFDVLDDFIYFKQNIINCKNILFKNFDYIKECYCDKINTDIYTLNLLTKNYLENIKQRLQHKKDVLFKLDPNNILKLGYACVKNNDSYVSACKDILIGDKLSIKFKDGNIQSVVTEVNYEF